MMRTLGSSWLEGYISFHDEIYEVYRNLFSEKSHIWGTGMNLPEKRFGATTPVPINRSEITIFRCLDVIVFFLYGASYLISGEVIANEDCGYDVQMYDSAMPGHCLASDLK
jgi:hypothetical protein